MPLFLLAFFLFYGGGHLYLFSKLRAAYPCSRRATWLLSLWLLLMTSAPLLVHGWARHASGQPLQLAAIFAYGWMGLLFYFVVIGVFLDALSLAGRLRRRSRRRRLSAGHLVTVTILLAMALVGYGYFEARAIRLERVVLPTAKLSPGVDRLKIVQLSDLHLGLLVGRERLRTVLSTVRRAEPDIIVATGDLLDGQGDNLPEFAALLREIPARHGKFAILGNHELYSGSAHATAFLEAAGFVVLRNEARAVAGGLVIAGVDDRRGATWPLAAADGEGPLLAALDAENRFVLLLKHRPQVNQASVGRFDLQLSGHVHGGQLFPFGLVVERFYPVTASALQPLAKGSLYVSRGAGTWGPPIRVLAPPEVNLIELRAAPPGAG